MGSQPRGIGQDAELAYQANTNDLKRAIPDWARTQNGVLMKDVELTYAPKAFGHGLGRMPSGWFVVRNYSSYMPAEHDRTARALVLSMAGERAFWQYSGTVAAAGVVQQTPMWEAHWPTEVLKAELITRLDVPADGTNYRGFYVYKRSAPAYGAEQIAYRDTSSDSISAFVPWEITLTGTATQLKLARGDLLTFASDVAAGGVAVYDSMVEVDLDAIPVDGSRKVDIWVY